MFATGPAPRSGAAIVALDIVALGAPVIVVVHVASVLLDGMEWRNACHVRAFLCSIIESRRVGARWFRPGSYRTDIVRDMDHMAHLLPSGRRRAALQRDLCATSMELQRRPVIDRSPLLILRVQAWKSA